MKIIVVILGAIMISLVFVVEKMGSVFQMTIGVTGTTAGAMLGMFTIGMVSRTANTKVDERKWRLHVSEGAQCSKTSI